MLYSECSIILNSNAHKIQPKSAQKCAQYFSPKKSKLFDPLNNFYCIFMHKFFEKFKIFKFFSQNFNFFNKFSLIFPNFCLFILLKKRTNFFQCATWLWKAHQCAHMRTLLNTLDVTLSKVQIFVCCFL